MSVKQQENSTMSPSECMVEQGLDVDSYSKAFDFPIRPLPKDGSHLAQDEVFALAYSYKSADVFAAASGETKESRIQRWRAELPKVLTRAAEARRRRLGRAKERNGPA
jgi:hypothetical protein